MNGSVTSKRTPPHRHCPTKPALTLLPALQVLAQLAQETTRVGAVDEPVVVGEGEFIIGLIAITS